MRLARDSAKLANMNDATNWKIAKWPFLLGAALLLAFAYFIVWKSPHPISQWEIIACFVSAGFGTVIGILPFIPDYRVVGKVVEADALGSVAEKIRNLEQLASQITSNLANFAICSTSSLEIMDL